MRFIALTAATLALAGCGQSQQHSNAGCTLEAVHQTSWTSQTAPDLITARADGPTCTQAAVTLVVRNAQGDLLWTFASSYYDMTAGGPAPEGAPATEPGDVEAFLASWADVTVLPSSDLPGWTETMAHPGEGVEPFGYDTPFERETYEALRTRALPMICYAAAIAAVQCLIIDPASHAPTLIAAYGS